MDQSVLLVAAVPPRAYVRVNGRGSFKDSPALKKFVASAMRQGCRTLIIDMEACDGMDSTFMGVLAGSALRLRKDACRGEVIMVNLDAKNISLLETLGLANVVTIVRVPLSDDQRRQFGLPSAGESAMDRLETDGQDRDSAAHTILAAHQDLIRVDSRNEPRFKNVILYLQDELRRKGIAESTHGA